MNSFNDTLKNQLGEIKGYLEETQHRLAGVSARSRSGSSRHKGQRGQTGRGATRRPVTSHAGSSNYHDMHTGLTERSLTVRSTASSYKSGDGCDTYRTNRVTTPTREWLAQVGHLTGSEVCTAAGKPSRLRREDLKEGQSTMLLVQGTKRQRAPAPGSKLHDTPRNQLESERFKCGLQIMDEGFYPQSYMGRARTPLMTPNTLKMEMTRVRTGRTATPVLWRGEHPADHHPGNTKITRDRPLRTNSEFK